MDDFDTLPKSGRCGGRRESLSFVGKLQEKVAGVSRRLSLGPADAQLRYRKISPRRPRKASCVSMVSTALSHQMQTTLVGAVPLVASSSFVPDQPGAGSEMGNKATSQSQSEEEGDAPRVPPLMAHTPAAGRPSTLENGDDADIDVELPSIPKMEIISHPMAAAGGPKATVTTLGATQVPDSSGLHSSCARGATKSSEGSTADLASELENIVKEKMELHESSDWDRVDCPVAGMDLSQSTGTSTLFHHNPSAVDEEMPMSPAPNLEVDKSPATADAETKEERELRRRDFVIRELIETERVYVSDLAVIVEGYIHEMRTPEAESRMPDDLKDGKDKIVFGNLEAIYEWHRDHFMKNIESFLDHPENIGPIFHRSEKKFEMYVKYCQNKPKSEYIVSEHFEYFEELRQRLGHKLQLADLLIKPVQRLMKYQLMLRDILKHTERAGLMPQVETMRKAFHIMTVVPKSADDMMNVGRLQGFAGTITSQGKLLLYGPLICSEGDSLTNFKGKELIVFLFEQSIIFSESEGKKKQFTNQQYIFKSYLQTNRIHFVERIDPSDPLKFLLKSTDPRPPRRDIAFVCQGANQTDRNEWVSLIRRLLQEQKDFLKAIQYPIEYQKEQTRNG